MLELKGKYNSAKVMIDKIDEATISQIYSFLNDESFAGSPIVIMPDCHAGAGSCIGFTMPMNDRVIPNVVGVDIGCGMLSAKFEIEDINVEHLDTWIKEKIPSGFSIHSSPKTKDFDLFDDTVKRLRLDSDKVQKSLGTLGGGNHFIEAGFDDNKCLWVTIHSGSRNFGLQIAKFYSEKAKENSGFLEVRSEVGQSYIQDQIIGSKYASLNRKLMLGILINFFDKDPVEIIESVHNFIDDNGMIRKGATPAHLNQKVIIPFNMRDGISICRGKGNRDYNFSAPHGAGRILSRSKAKAELDVNAFINDMKASGVFTTTATSSTLDEAPDAYKNMNVILENIKDTVEVLTLIKPVYNFKAIG